MKSFKLITVLLLPLLMAFLITISSAQPTKNNDNDDDNENNTIIESFKGSNSGFLNNTLRSYQKDSYYNPYRSWGRDRNATRRRRQLTCKRFPRICRMKGSPGPDCCRKKCVNVKKDRLNCGMCGRRCRYPEICCNGRCVSPLYDRRNCGGCRNRCKRGSFCYYGMCSYA